MFRIPFLWIKNKPQPIPKKWYPNNIGTFDLYFFISRSIGSSEHWICSKCTLRNPLSALKCRVCENSRKLPKTATNHSSHSSSNSLINSKCTVCTYVNVPGRKKCEMCSTSLKSQNIITMAPTPTNTPSTIQPAPPSSQTVAPLTANCKF